MRLIVVEVPPLSKRKAAGNQKVKMRCPGPMEIQDRDVGFETPREETTCGPFEEILGLLGGDERATSPILEQEGQEAAILDAIEVNEPFDFDLEGERGLPACGGLGGVVEGRAATGFKVLVAEGILDGLVIRHAPLSFLMTRKGAVQ